eukprot:scaffold30922_cov20-Prasinocladus_malaysianus.AAC.1
MINSQSHFCINVSVTSILHAVARHEGRITEAAIRMAPVLKVWPKRLASQHQLYLPEQRKLCISTTLENSLYPNAKRPSRYRSEGAQALPLLNTLAGPHPRVQRDSEVARLSLLGRHLLPLGMPGPLCQKTVIICL